jgi:hypothetical protein
MNKSADYVLAYFAKDHTYMVVHDEKKKLIGLLTGVFETNDGWCKGKICLRGTQADCEKYSSQLTNGATKSDLEASDCDTAENFSSKLSIQTKQSQLKLN